MHFSTETNHRGILDMPKLGGGLASIQNVDASNGTSSVHSISPSVLLCTSTTHEIKGSIWETLGVLPEIRLFTDVPDYLSYASTLRPFVPLEVTLLKRKAPSTLWDIIIRYEDQEGKEVWSRITPISAAFYPIALDMKMRALMASEDHEAKNPVGSPAIPLNNGVALWLRCVNALDPEDLAKASAKLHNAATAANSFAQGVVSDPESFLTSQEELRKLCYPVAVMPERISLPSTYAAAVDFWSKNTSTFIPASPPEAFAVIASSQFGRHEVAKMMEVAAKKTTISIPNNNKLPAWITYRTPRTILEAVKDQFINLGHSNFWWTWDTVNDDIFTNCNDPSEELASPFRYILKTSQNVRTTSFRPFYTKSPSKFGSVFLSESNFAELDALFGIVP